MPHPYQHILPDCLSHIFRSFYLFHIDETAEILLVKQQVSCFSRNAPQCCSTTNADLSFLATHAKLLKFHPRVHVGNVLNAIRRATSQQILSRSGTRRDSGGAFAKPPQAHSPNSSEQYTLPQFLYIDVTGNHTLNDSVFSHFAGIHTLLCGGLVMPQETIHDSPKTISPQAFRHLRGIHTLEANDLDFLTDEHLVPLRGSIHTLNISSCHSVTSEGFKNLRGTIHTLIAGDLPHITDAALENLQGTIHTLVISRCLALTDAGFSSLKGIVDLDMSRNHQETLTDAAFLHLRGVKRLSMGFCAQKSITDAALANLIGIESLNIMGCKQFTSKAFPHLRGIKELCMNQASQESIQNEALHHLKGIEEIDLNSVNQITGEGLCGLGNYVRVLNVNWCNRITLDMLKCAFASNAHLEKLCIVGTAVEVTDKDDLRDLKHLLRHAHTLEMESGAFSSKSLERELRQYFEEIKGGDATFVVRVREKSSRKDWSS
mmetsp:Transcript_8845/g.32658  ORF Transcript_8845/g.32658 Transcript_8845/m.32658 type:complete len:489 (-) Transcript_8845:36-1502(-)